MILLSTGGLLACGADEEPSAPTDAGAADADAESHQHEPDPEDDVVPCPSSTPDFEPGMTVAGESMRISARLIGASPATPRKFENNWVFEFIDAAGQPIEDVAVTPDEPWMDVHGHGGGYMPDVVVLDQPAQLEFDRINLRMSGPWRFNLNASSARLGSSDVIEIHVCVP